jgi:hypothetical protein
VPNDDAKSMMAPTSTVAVVSRPGSLWKPAA